MPLLLPQPEQLDIATIGTQPPKGSFEAAIAVENTLDILLDRTRAHWSLCESPYASVIITARCQASGLMLDCLSMQQHTGLQYRQLAGCNEAVVRSVELICTQWGLLGPA